MFLADNVFSSLFRQPRGLLARPEPEPDDVRQLTRCTSDATDRYDQAEGVVALHSACRTLLRTPDHVVRAVSVLVPLVEFPIPPTSVVDLAERIAGEHGLVAQATCDGRFLRVRLTRFGGSGGGTS